MHHAAKVRQAPAATAPSSRAAILPDHRPAAVAQRELIHQVQSGPRQTAQRRLTQLATAPLQRKVGFEWETDTLTRKRGILGGAWAQHSKGQVLSDRAGYQITADVGGLGSVVEFILKPIDETNAGAVANLIGVTVPAMVADADLIANAADVAGLAANPNHIMVGPMRFLRGHHIAGLHGSRYQAFQAQGPAPTYGQLQMTGGIPMSKLHDHVSGAQAANYLATLPAPIGPADPNFVILNTLNNYTMGGPMPAAADAAVLLALPGLAAPARDMIAAVATMMATMIVNTRGAPQDYAKAFAGPRMARTDYGRILMELPPAAKLVLTPAIMRQVVLAAATAGLPLGPAPVGGNPVIPLGAVAPPGLPVPNLTGLTIDAWVGGVVPTPGPIGGYQRGRDQLTKKHFPGTKAQRAEMESLGSYPRTDPAAGAPAGRRPIIEFRSLGGVFANDLVGQISRLIDFLNH